MPVFFVWCNLSLFFCLVGRNLFSEWLIGGLAVGGLGF